MKTKRFVIMFVAMIALFLISSQVMAAPQAAVPKSTPPGQAKTPEAEDTQEVEDQEDNQRGNPHGKHENYKGTISALDSGSITLTLKDESTVTITLTGETDIKIRGQKNASSSELAVGMTVMVQAIRAEDDSLTARRVMLIPGKPAKIHRVGVVTAYEAGISITIQAKDEQFYTFLLTDKTKILPAERVDMLKVGARVTIIYPRDVTTQDRTATGIVVHPADTED